MSLTAAWAAKDRVRFRLTMKFRIALTRAALILGALVLWEILARLAGPSDLIAPPAAVLSALFSTILSDPDIRAALGSALVEIVLAYALAIGAGLVVGFGVGSSRFGRRALYPVVLLLYAIPQVVLLPLFVLGFGIGPAAKIAFGFSHGVFPIIVNVAAGMRNVDPRYLRAASAMGASRSDIFRDVTFPHMVASFFTGLRLAMTMTLLGVILAELYVSTSGVGYFARQFAETFDPAPLFALIGALAAMALALNAAVRIAERRFTRWKQAGRSS